MDFGDIFHDLNLDGPQHGFQRSSYEAVPDAPVVSDIPDLDSLLGSGDVDLLELRASQWLPATQRKLPLREITNSPILKGPVYSKDKRLFQDGLLEPMVSERGDSQEIYLGSQFPIVKKVKLSKNALDGFAAPPKESQQKSSHSAQKISRLKIPKFNRVTPQFREVTNDGDHIFETPAALILPATKQRQGMHLRSVLEIPEQYRPIFKFQYFNIVQSKVFDDVLYTDRSLVVCSPTGSGKTAIFEMAIIRLLTNIGPFNRSFKVVYMAPIKALCSERYQDWRDKFEPLGLRVMELTGDTDLEDFYLLQEVNIILTTPEKWDSMTRKWRDNKSVVQAIYLFLVDEIHILNDETRGATVEAVLSRMKTIQAAKSRTKSSGKQDSHELRFVAASATLTNVEDIAAWLGTGKNPALHHKFDDKVRPVRLRKVVLGYNFNDKQSPFQFDITLNYKLAGIINTYSEGKPTLVFCSTRKSVTQGADTLAKDMKSSFVRSGQHRQHLQNSSFHIKDSKLRELVMKGIGFHHAGMDFQDRKIVEEMFSNGELPVLVATSTLAMGVNLPAHLVIIKSTMYYNMGCHEEYSDTQVLQMIGRAGRPQFDTSATAVIMTKHQTKEKYDNLINGTQLIESNLHKNLIEHLNAEIVLGTITDMSVAVEWLKFTFLYIRVMKNPRHYGMPAGLTKTLMEKRLQDMCMKNLNQLLSLNLLKMNEDTLDVIPTDNGRLMARYCISYKTAELFNSIKEEETISDLLAVISKCKEFEDIKLRINERKTLNTLNKDKNRATIRYPLTGKIKTTDMKVNCLVQAQLGSLLVQDFALQQDTSRIFRVGTRIMRCLVEFLSPRENIHGSMLSAMQLCKAFKARLWENSKFVSKQLEGIGPTLSNALVNAGLTTFEKIEQTNPREIELIVNRHPPFGNQVRDSALDLPKYELVIEQIARYSENSAELVFSLEMTNRDHLKEKSSTGHTCTLLVGDKDNRILYKQRIMDSMLLKENSWTKKIDIHLARNGPDLDIHYISQDWVGLDIECIYTPIYIGGMKISNSTATVKDESIGSCKAAKTMQKPKRKQTKSQTKPSEPKPKSTCTKGVANYLKDLKAKSSLLPNTPSLTKRPRLQFSNEKNRRAPFDLTQYGYTPKPKYGCRSPESFQQNETCNFDENETLYAVPYNTFYATEEGLQDETIDNRNELQMPRSLNKNSGWPELDLYQRHREICRIEEVQEDYMDDESLPDLDCDQAKAASNMDDTLATSNMLGFNDTSSTSNMWNRNSTATTSNMNDCYKAMSNMKDNFRATSNRGDNLRPTSNMQNGFRPTSNMQENLRPKSNIQNNFRPTSNMKDNMRPKSNVQDNFRPTSNMQDDLRPKSNVQDNFKPTSNMQDDLRPKSNVQDNFRPTSNMQNNVRPKSNMQNNFRPKSNTRIQNNFRPTSNMQDNINTQATPNVMGYKNPLATSNIQNYNSTIETTSMQYSDVTYPSLDRMVQETDYGCVYVGEEDQVIDWDDRVTENINKGSPQSRYTKETGLQKNTTSDDAVDDIQCYESDDENKHSKWTSYFSSQSSTASDYLKSKCPARYDTHHVVMQDSKSTTVKDGKAIEDGFSAINRSSNGRRSTTICPARGNGHISPKDKTVGNLECSRKYGQVLAWISNSQNKDLTPKTSADSDLENWSDDDNFVDLCGGNVTCDSKDGNRNVEHCRGVLTPYTGNNEQQSIEVLSEADNVCDMKSKGAVDPPANHQDKKNWPRFFPIHRTGEEDGDFNNIFDGLF